MTKPAATPNTPTPRRWPLFDLSILTAHLELRIPTDEQLFELAELATKPIHEPGAAPFLVPWTDGTESQRAVGTLQWNWRARAEFSPEQWRLNFVVICNDEIIGAQDLCAEVFVERREVSTGSWLVQSEQGKGYGKEMRSAVLTLAFDSLGARWATSSSRTDNLSSRGVSVASGYRHDGVEVDNYKGSEVVRDRWRLSRSDWINRHDSSPVRIDGIAACLSMLGLAD